MQLSLVLVHLGSLSSEHLWVTAERIRSIWPKLQLWLILDDETNISIAKKINFKVFDFRDFGDKNDLNEDTLKFRNGFWTLTKERISALLYFHQEFPELRILHIENDILLLRNFPFEYFEQLEKNSWMKVSNEQDSAAIIYLPRIETTKWLENEFNSLSLNDSLLTDMQILSIIRKKYPEEINLLPTFGSNLESELGYFDAAELGMWITGEDPRNNFGITKRFNNRFNLDGLTKFSQPFDLIDDNLVRKGNISTNIFNLHIHSKDLQLLGLEAEEKLRALLKTKSLILKRYSFSFQVLREIILEYRHRKKLISLLAALPGLRVLRNYLIKRLR